MVKTFGHAGLPLVSQTVLYTNHKSQLAYPSSYILEYSSARRHQAGAPSILQLALSHRLCLFFQVYNMCTSWGQPRTFHPDRFPTNLKQLLSSFSFSKVGARAAYDAIMLKKHYAVHLNNLVDLRSLAHARGLPTTTLGGLSYMYGGPIHMSVEEDLSREDWDAEILQQNSVFTAANKAFASRMILDRMVCMPDPMPCLDQIQRKKNDMKKIPEDEDDIAEALLILQSALAGREASRERIIKTIKTRHPRWKMVMTEAALQVHVEGVVRDWLKSGKLTLLEKIRR
ncbi:hypothetical protein, variant [Spizellomyces punctatus DAOM BR117]|uniref:3'-5' exonuclease domain-containing protein n=1 Tax=Spizellomyces punctatus (strain DAOM BR117) TaxID=645134 RepID=A0A0L0HC83_SPIPD|nr:hypothetical protein, variant [Spizellomyces punctatus DAOM BR117]KNC98494.1 hypothetical protein, variant [Spizellomyces punctatus DAOM BR117]|eukprot:XP_016606534.1 hypothetical protein, variant [Spizellomyces punctatus DAOM BR117]